MGKPFKNELALLKDTFNWAKSLEINKLKLEVEKLLSHPMFIVGSGGAFSACHMMAILQQSRGGFAKPITPLELHYSSGSIRKSNVFFLSASGKNSDILFAYNTAVRHDPQKILGLCLKNKTKLSLAAGNHSISKIFEIDNPAGKDGFLATNSLVAYFTILSKMYGYDFYEKELIVSKQIEKEIAQFAQNLPVDFTLVLMYAGWSQPVAIDIESKFTEAGLGNVLFSDFRNFGHGRHNWLDKRKDKTAIVVLVTPSEKELASKTLALIPKDIPKLILSTDHSGPLSSIDLLIQSFYLAGAVGDKVKIDPGKPGVPAYGSKLYNLKYQSLVEIEKTDYKSINAILRKTGCASYSELTEEERLSWQRKLTGFRKDINAAKFGAIIFDYDGTLCTNEERMGNPSPLVIEALNSFISRGFVIGIVTGRGKSIRTCLSESLDKKYHNNVIIGYYNGAVIAPLTDIDQPDTDSRPKLSLEKITDLLNQNISVPPTSYELTLRPMQLTIESGKEGRWQVTKSRILEVINKNDIFDVRVLESGHSIDIIARPEVSKLNIVSYCIDLCKKRGLVENYVCLGDKGRFPGNDFELLTTRYSLSVDEVSIDADSCWNLSDIGNRGVSSSLQYLNSAKFDSNFFKLTV